MRPTPPETVALIKAIVNQDKRERLAAGYRRGSPGLAKRIAEALNLNIYTVLETKEGRRNRKVHSHERLFRGLTVPPERLERLREYNERQPRKSPPPPTTQQRFLKQYR